ncbi:hypothetical protein ACFL57_01490 [Candidatus Margulisiibacteriota bacterium]
MAGLNISLVKDWVGYKPISAKDSRKRAGEEPKPKSEVALSMRKEHFHPHYEEDAKGVKLKFVTKFGGIGFEGEEDLGITNNNSFSGNLLTLPGDHPWMRYKFTTLGGGWCADTKYLPDGSALNPNGCRIKAMLCGQQVKGETETPLADGGKNIDIFGMMGKFSIQKTDGPLNGLKLAFNYQYFNTEINVGSELGLIPGMKIPYTEEFTLTGNIRNINLNIPIAQKLDILAGLKTTTINNKHKLPGQNVIPAFGHPSEEKELTFGAKNYLPWGTLSTGSIFNTGTTMGSGVEGKIDPEKSAGFFINGKIFGKKPEDDIKWGITYRQLIAKSHDKTFLSDAIIPLVGIKRLATISEETSKKNLELYFNTKKAGLTLGYSKEEGKVVATSLIPMLDTENTCKKEMFSGSVYYKPDFENKIMKNTIINLSAFTGTEKHSQYGQNKKHSLFGFNISVGKQF